MDTSLIGVCADCVIGDTDSYPYGALLVGTLADHLEHPHLVLVSDREGFARAIVAIVTYEVGHHTDGLTCGLRALESNIDEAPVVHDPLGVRELLAPTPGTLSDSHLMLVHVPDDIVGDGSLWDEAEGLARVPLVYLQHESLAPSLGRVVDEVAIEGV